MNWPSRASVVRVSTSWRLPEGPWRKMMLTGCAMLAVCSPCCSVVQDAHADGVVGRVGDSLGLAVGDRVGHVGEGQDSRLSSRKSGESAEKEGLGEHLDV